jgi:transposase
VCCDARAGLCARLYGKRAAKKGAKKAIEAIEAIECEVLFRQAVGVSRLLTTGRWPSGRGSTKQADKPSEAALRRQLNSVKRQQFPWMRLVPKSVPQQAIKNCGAPFQRFFKKQGRDPKFKTKGVRDSARLDNGPGTFEFDGKPLVPQQQDCSACGRISEELPLSIRERSCECGTFHDRDRNAARNLRRYAPEGELRPNQRLRRGRLALVVRPA